MFCNMCDAEMGTVLKIISPFSPCSKITDQILRVTVHLFLYISWKTEKYVCYFICWSKTFPTWKSEKVQKLIFFCHSFANCLKKIYFSWLNTVRLLWNFRFRIQQQFQREWNFWDAGNYIFMKSILKTGLDVNICCKYAVQMLQNVNDMKSTLINTTHKSAIKREINRTNLWQILISLIFRNFIILILISRK